MKKALLTITCEVNMDPQNYALGENPSLEAMIAEQLGYYAEGAAHPLEDFEFSQSNIKHYLTPIE